MNKLSHWGIILAVVTNQGNIDDKKKKKNEQQ